MNNRTWIAAALTFFLGLFTGCLWADILSPVSRQMQRENLNLRRQVKLLESQLADINDVLRESDPNQGWKAD